MERVIVATESKDLRLVGRNRCLLNQIRCPVWYLYTFRERYASIVEILRSDQKGTGNDAVVGGAIRPLDEMLNLGQCTAAFLVHANEFTLHLQLRSFCRNRINLFDNF